MEIKCSGNLLSETITDSLVKGQEYMQLSGLDPHGICCDIFQKYSKIALARTLIFLNWPHS